MLNHFWAVSALFQFSYTWPSDLAPYQKSEEYAGREQTPAYKREKPPVLITHEFLTPSSGHCSPRWKLAMAWS
jgi:hypothetical protein